MLTFGRTFNLPAQLELILRELKQLVRQPIKKFAGSAMAVLI